MRYGKLKILTMMLLSLGMGAAQAQSVWKFEGGGWRSLYLLPGCSLTIQKSKNGFVFKPESETRIQFWGAWPAEPGTVEFPILESIQNRVGPASIEPRGFKVTFEKSANGEVLPVSYRFDYKDQNFEFSKSCQDLAPVN